MSLRPPSLQSAYDDFYTGDSAIIPLPDEKLEAERAKWFAAIRTARETGDWAPVTMPDQTPARFVMKPISGNAYRELYDMMVKGEHGPAMVGQLAFRLAIKSVVDASLGDGPKVKLERHARLGELATVSIANYFDSIDPGIVTQLGDEAFRRARDVSPK